MTMAARIDDDTFDAKVRELADGDGMSVVLGIPGVFELVREFYTNDAIRACEEDLADEESA